MTSFVAIKQTAERHGIEPAICCSICAMLDGRNLSSILSGEKLKTSTARGCPQGGMLLLLLWNLVEVGGWFIFYGDSTVMAITRRICL
jgi:hypothetical protein